MPALDGKLRWRIPALGSLRDRVRLLKPRDDGLLVPIATVWAKVEHTGGLSFITIRYRDDLEVGDVVHSDGLYCPITRVEDINGRKAYLDIVARPILPDQH